MGPSSDPFRQFAGSAGGTSCRIRMAGLAVLNPRRNHTVTQGGQHMRALLVGIALLFLGLPALAQQAPIVRPAVDGIFEAFQNHPLVGLGEAHRRAQELDFYTALLRDPRFARDVGNVVVEFGGAAHQDIIDRYVSGEDVPYTELRKVWTGTLGWTGVVRAMGYHLFYGRAREINRGLPPERRVHVWLGEPVIDWTTVKTHADWE